MKTEIEFPAITDKQALSSIRRIASIGQWDTSRRLREIRRVIAEREDVVDEAIEKTKIRGGETPLTKERAFELTYSRPTEKQHQYPTMVSWERFIKAMDIYADSKIEQYKRSRK